MKPPFNWQSGKPFLNLVMGLAKLSKKFILVTKGSSKLPLQFPATVCWYICTSQLCSVRCQATSSHSSGGSTKMAILRDGQAIVMGDLSAPEAQNNSVTKHPVRLIFVRAFINDANGKPLHVWQQRAHETRFYPEATPNTQSEIVARVQPSFS